MLGGSLDIVWGAGVLQAATISNFEEDEMLDRFSVFHSGIIQHTTILLLNSGKAPLDDITVRKALIHAIDKKDIIKLELGEDTRTVDSVLSLDAPYCNIEFTPKWDCDLEKAELLNCPAAPVEEVGNNSRGLAIGLGVSALVLPFHFWELQASIGTGAVRCTRMSLTALRRMRNGSVHK